MENVVKLTDLMTTLVYDLGLLLIFLLAGVMLLKLVKPLRKLYLPAGLIGGAAALILGPQVLGIIELPASWSGFANPMIGITIGCSIFGTNINGKKIKQYSGAVNVIVLTYFAQMLVGTLAGLGLSQIWKGMPYSWGTMSIYTYWGGHGAALAAGGLFEELGNEGMSSLGIIMATLGLVAAMVAGMVWVNIGERKGWSKYRGNGGGSEAAFPFPVEGRKPLGYESVSSDVANGLALQLGIVLLCVLIGKWLFGGLSRVPVPAVAGIMSKIPMFLYGTVGAIILWPVMRKTHTDRYADLPTIKSIGGVALEICIASATSTLNLQLLADYLAPILLHMLVIIALMSFITMVIVRKWLGADWFELALMAFGQGHGSTPSGLALARCTDPDHKSYAWEAFGIALGIFTPITSVLAASFPALIMKSIWFPIGIGAAVTVGCILFGELFVRKQNL